MSLRGPLPDVEIPNVSLYEYLLGSLDDADLERTAIEQPHTSQSLTFRQVRDDVLHVAAWFAANGIGAGDVVALALPTCPETSPPSTVYAGRAPPRPR